jgi:hypothetical protein
MWTETTAIFDFISKNGYYRKRKQTEGQSTAEYGRDHVTKITRY